MRAEGIGTGQIKRDGNIMSVAPLAGGKHKLTERDWKAVEQCHPFVFTQPQYDTDVIAGVDLDKQIDAPFPVFSIEVLSGHVLEITKSESGLDARRRMYVDCIIVIEKSPKVFTYFALIEGVYAPDIVDMHNEVFENKKIYGSVFGAVVMESEMVSEIVHEFIARLNREKIGAETVRHSVKIGTGSGKRMHRIRRIIYVAPKREVESSKSELPRSIDWTHRFEVRGHWRKTDKLGKDREGNYCVEGHTWVVNHVRGPEHLPIVKKTRLV